MRMEDHGPDIRTPKRRKLDRETCLNEGELEKMSTIEDVEGGPHITLSAQESVLRRLLLDTANYIKKSSPQGRELPSALPSPNEVTELPVILRFTGGWVRDKLLGVNSDDIDVAINNMTGYSFGLKMLEYLEIAGNARKYGFEDAPNVPEGYSSGARTEGIHPSHSRDSKSLSGLHKIKANPEKSKHLETASIQILGFAIDLVNLRTETYTEDSRNPQMMFGTPQEDALRRDATVNALFYNLNSSSLEDFTGRGLMDMRLGIIRTPVEPRQTFLDDPLRVLRLVRFASRLGFTIEPETERWMKNDTVKAALQTKVSRERVGIEIEKMLKGARTHCLSDLVRVLTLWVGNDPSSALVLIDRLGLYLTVFPEPPDSSHARPNLDYWHRAYNFMSLLTRNPAHTHSNETGSESVSILMIKTILLRDHQDKEIAWLLAALVPWVAVSPVVPSKSLRKETPSLPAIVARNGIKVKNTTFEIIKAATNYGSEITKVQGEVVKQANGVGPLKDESSLVGRDSLGMAIRRWGDSWRLQVLLALLLDIYHQKASELSRGMGFLFYGYSTPRLNITDTSSIINKYAVFLTYLKDADLLDVCSLKPVLNGTQLASALGIKPGPWVKEALDLVMAWQLLNPGADDSEGAMEEVKRKREKLGIK